MAESTGIPQVNTSSWVGGLPFNEHLTPPVQICLLVVMVFIARTIWNRKREQSVSEEMEPILEPMAKRDFTLSEIREFNGKDGARLLLAVNGKVFDVTKSKSFYGAGGPYSCFAGQDASRGLATFSIDASSIKEEYDDLADLSPMQMDSMLEWEMQFMEKYDVVGKLLRPGEKHTNYSYTETESEGETDVHADTKAKKME